MSSVFYGTNLGRVCRDAIFTGILHDTDHLSFFLEYMCKGISMFFVSPPHPRENNDLEFVGEGRTTSPIENIW